MTDLEAPIPGARRTEIGGLIVDEVPAGTGRVKRVIYPAGWHWQDHMAPVTHTTACMHAHVGFLAQGTMVVRYTDGCEVTLVAPAPVVIEPGHDGWVVGDEPCVLIQVDLGPETVDKLGLVGEHRHA
jgi:hypothetical protein